MNIARARCLIHLSRIKYTTSINNINPWFVSPTPPPASSNTALNPNLPPDFDIPPPPSSAPPFLLSLHSTLATSPLLDVSQLLLSKPIINEEGPGLPIKKAHGRRRRRGGVNGGIGIEAAEHWNGGLGGGWDWVLYAQVWTYRLY